MCLSTVYKRSGPEPVMSNVQSAEVRDGVCVFVDIMGREVELKGEILSIDFTGGKIVVNA